MKKTIVTITTIAIIGLGGSIFSKPVQAETVSELEGKQTQVESDRSEVKEKLSKAEAEIADLLFDLKDLNEDIVRVDQALKDNQKVLKKTKNDVSETKEEIGELEEDIVELEEGIEERFDVLKERVTSYQKNGGNIGFLEVLFGAKSFGEFIGRANAVTKITSSDEDLMNKQEEDKAEVEKKQKEVKEKLKEQTEMKVELEGMESLILDQQKENKKSKKTLTDKEKELTALKVDLESEDSSLASLEAEIRQDIASARTPSTAVASAASSSNDDLVTLSDKSEKSSKPVSGSGGLDVAINAGFQHLGTPYVWAGKGPGGFDCSGFVSWAYDEAGYNIPSSTAGLSGTGTKVSSSNMQPGDLVFFNTYKTNGHVGIYLGGGNFIGAQNSTGLAVANMTSGYWKEKFAGHVRRVN